MRNTSYQPLRSLFFSSISAVLPIIFLTLQPSTVLGSAPTPSNTPLAITLPPIETASSVEALRTLHGVHAMQPIDDQRNIYALPDSIYGFTVPWLLDSDPTGVVGGTGVGRLSLTHQSGGTLVMEVHKTAAQQIYIIGFATTEDVQRLTKPDGDSIELVLFMQPTDLYTTPVAIPVRRMLHTHFRSVGQTYVLDLVVAVGATLNIKMPPPAPPLVLPAAGANPILVASSVAALRIYNGVHELRWLDEDKALNQVPDGVLGYTVPWLLNTDPAGVGGGTGVNTISLWRESGGTAVMEVHKTVVGQVYILCYMSDADIAKLREAHNGSVSAILAMKPYQNYAHPVAIPVERFLYSDNRSIHDGSTYTYVNDVEISTASGKQPLIVTLGAVRYEF